VILVVGLGNSGRRYARTPHNVGFVVVDELAQRAGCRLRRSWRFDARIAKGDVAGRPAMLAKPETYMNNSGIAVGAMLRYYKLDAAALIVVLDDADLPQGRIRIRPKGRSGGHRGLASVIEHIGGSAFTRVRIGVGRRDDAEDLVGHVLQPYGEAAWQRMEAAARVAADAVGTVVDEGVAAAMNRYNGVAAPGTTDDETE